MEAESLIKEEVEKLCHQIQNCHIRNEVIELHVRFLAFTTDTISSFAFAETLGLQDDYNQAEDWAETLRKIGKVTPLLRQFPSAISIALKMPFRIVEFVVPALSRMLKLHHKTQSLAFEFLKNEKINPSPMMEKRSTRPPTIFHAIYQSSLGPEEKALDRLSQEGVLMFAAGSEGTSRIIMLATYYLLTNPTALIRLRPEIMDVMPDPRIIPSMDVLRDLPWLHAIVKETLRNSAIFTSRFPLYSPYDLQFQEWTIPSKTPISMTTRSVLKDSSIFPSPDTFDPERWLQGSLVHHDLDRYYVPFGKGTRMCPGMDLAYTEIHMALVVLFRRFEFELFDTVKERDIDVVRDCFMGEATPNSLGREFWAMGFILERALRISYKEDNLNLILTFDYCVLRVELC
ncbi:hypothetical protein B7494_g3093 [Chlorociboria aeruginascens]|nr:hypothetical protein B7494_g3093 [Chlorociboria aeruginascens]